MVLDPISTFFLYVGGIALLFTVCAAVADILAARDEREARRRVRAEARAELRRERESFDFDGWERSF